MSKLFVNIFIIGLLLLSAFSFNGSAYAAEPLRIFAADSLKNQMEITIQYYKQRFPDAPDPILNCSGSQSIIRWVTDDKQPCDVLASADYGLIDDRLMYDYTHWNGEYARNSMAIAYRKDSPHVSDINADNWYDILNMPDVRFGFGNPNMDPCGYRTVMDIALANRYYGSDKILDNLILANSEIKADKTADGYEIGSPTDVEKTTNPNIVIDEHAADSLTNLTRGVVDYAFVYMNQAEEAKRNDSNIDYFTLPDDLSLNDVRYEDEYSHYILTEYYNDPLTAKNITLTPIVYGITPLINSHQPKEADDFIEVLWTTLVQNPDIFFMDPIFPVVASKKTIWNDIPDQLQRFMVPSDYYLNGGAGDLSVDRFKSSASNPRMISG